MLGPRPRAAALPADLEWKVTYVGSAESDSYDQELESVLVGPVVVGTYEFAMEASAPDPSKIPPEDIVGITVVLVTCSYRSQEFIRVGEALRGGANGIATAFPAPEAAAL